MSEHQKQTEFLRRCLHYDDTAGSRQLAERIVHLQHDERRVRRGGRLMAALAGLAVVGLCYSAVFLAYYPENFWGFTSRIVTQVFGALGLVALVCLLVFACLGMIYRKELDKRRDECRQLVAKIMESRLGRPVITSVRTMPDNPVSAGNGRTVRFADEAQAAPLKIESPAQG